MKLSSLQLYSVDVEASVRELEQTAIDLLLEGVVTAVDKSRIQITTCTDVIFA